LLDFVAFAGERDAPLCVNLQREFPPTTDDVFWHTLLQSQATLTVACPAKVIDILPPHMHISLQVLFSAGCLPTITVGEPGAQGAVVTGKHGMGVRTPLAAEVAAATWGFESVLHIPNGAMLSTGLLSWMLAAGCEEAITRLRGSTVNVPGARPKVHIRGAPFTTCCAIL
jgi:hypothetical protein